MEKGINVLKQDLTALASIAQVVDKSLEDKKVNVIEGIKIALKSSALIKVVKNIKEAKAELLDLDGAEKQELTNHFKAEFDLRNDDAEAAVESVVALAINMSDSLTLLSKSKTNEN